jgi:F-type H+-transporting ATPase subunit b
MPQLDVSTFVSQLFWLLLTFVPLYLVLWKVALPRVAEVLENRQNRIEHDLERAEKLKQEAEAALAAYEGELAEARGRAQAALREAQQQAAAEAQTRHDKLTERLAGELDAAEARIDAARREAAAGIRDVAVELAAAAAEKLAGTAAPDRAVRAAVDAAMPEER